ncbi:MAG: hypothetical protein RIQ52_992 [Pseudomonadota bacterium]|jgi:nitrogen regulatory protein PII
MKEIRAYIQPFMMCQVTEALMGMNGFPGMSINDCEGFGQLQTLTGQAFEPFTSKKRLEIFAPDDMVEDIVNTIMQVANTLQSGAGKIYVIDVMEGYRIRTGEHGPDTA